MGMRKLIGKIAEHWRKSSTWNPASRVQQFFSCRPHFDRDLLERPTLDFPSRSKRSQVSVGDSEGGSKFGLADAFRI